MILERPPHQLIFLKSHNTKYWYIYNSITNQHLLKTTRIFPLNSAKVYILHPLQKKEKQKGKTSMFFFTLRAAVVFREVEFPAARLGAFHAQNTITPSGFHGSRTLATATGRIRAHSKPSTCDRETDDEITKTKFRERVLETILLD